MRRMVQGLALTMGRLGPLLFAPFLLADADWPKKSNTSECGVEHTTLDLEDTKREDHASLTDQSGGLDP
jgi:hypothetical protein